MELFKNKSFIFLSLFIVTIFLLSTVTTSFAFRVGGADPLINNIWLEPENPKPGDMVSIRSSIYNQGTQSTKEVTDVTTIGYFINGELVKISPLTDVRPGAKNGIIISTGPIWKATDGTHTITVILNYHDTLSHLTDNFENNIMQKKYYIGDWQNSSQPLISFELFQETIPNTKNQIVKIDGKITLPENYPKYRTPKVDLEFIDGKNSTQKFPIMVDKKTSFFYWRETIPVSNMIIPMKVSFSDERYKNFPYDYTLNLYPVNLEQNESLFALTLYDPTESYNFKNQNFNVIVYDESYQLIKKTETNQMPDYTIKKTETIQLPASPFKKNSSPVQSNPTFSTSPNGDLLYIILPGGITYNFEIYSENKLEYSALKFLEPNKILNDIIKDKNIYNVNPNQNEFLLSLTLSDPTNSYTFKNSEFTIVVFQDSYDNLFKQISTSELDDLSSIYNDDLLTVLPTNYKYIVEVYLEGKFITVFETSLTNNDVINKQILIPKPAQIRFEIINELGNPLNNVHVKNWIYSTVSNEYGLTDWIEVIPTINNNEPYVAKATFPDGTVIWSEEFQIKSGESKTIQIIQGDHVS